MVSIINETLSWGKKLFSQISFPFLYESAKSTYQFHYFYDKLKSDDTGIVLLKCIAIYLDKRTNHTDRYLLTDSYLLKDSVHTDASLMKLADSVPKDSYLLTDSEHTGTYLQIQREYT